MVEITVKGKHRKKRYVVNKPGQSDAGKGRPTLSLKNKPKPKAQKQVKKSPPPAKPKQQQQQKQKAAPQPKKVKRPKVPYLLRSKHLNRLRRLAAALPHIICIDDPNPVCIGFLEELRADPPEGISNRCLLGAMKVYPHLPQYHRAIKQGKMRLNRQGEVVEAPTDKHKANADKKLAQWEETKVQWAEQYAKITAEFPDIFLEASKPSI